MEFGDGYRIETGTCGFRCVHMLQTLTEILRALARLHRGFQQDRFDVERENSLEGMKQRNDTPQSISGREWGWLMRGPDFFGARVMTLEEQSPTARFFLSSPDNEEFAVSMGFDPLLGLDAQPALRSGSFRSSAGVDSAWRVSLSAKGFRLVV